MKVRDDIPPHEYRDVIMFEGLDDEHLDTLAPHLEYRIYEEGESIVEEGACCRDMYVLLDGRVRVTRSSDGPDPVELAVVEPEAILGELGFVLGTPRSATARPDEGAHLLHLAGPPRVERRRDDDMVACQLEHNVLRSLAQRQYALNDRLSEVIEDCERGSFERDDITHLRDKLDEHWSF